jgi:hypothetical protein
MEAEASCPGRDSGRARAGGGYRGPYPGGASSSGRTDRGRPDPPQRLVSLPQRPRADLRGTHPGNEGTANQHDGPAHTQRVTPTRVSLQRGCHPSPGGRASSSRPSRARPRSTLTVSDQPPTTALEASSDVTSRRDRQLLGLARRTQAHAGCDFARPRASAGVPVVRARAGRSLRRCHLRESALDVTG